MPTAMESFLAVHDRCLEASQHVYTTGETSGIKQYLAPGYHGYFGTRDEERASFYALEESLDGMVQTGKAFPGIRASFSHRHAQMPSEREAIVIYVKSMDFGNGKVGHACIMEVWRQVESTWLLIRETVESA